MRWIRLLCATLLLVSAGLVVTARPASACSCAARMTPAQALEMSETTFSGRVIDVDRPLVTGHDVKLTFAVDRVFKGLATRDTVVRTADQGTACGLELTKGGSYVVFATGSGAVVHANSCGGTYQGRPDDTLGSGRAPDPARLFHRPPLGAMIIVLGAGLGLWRLVVARRRRRQR